jgi:serine/threonine protein kinase
MEYCDKGSLRHAMKRGVFHKRLGSTSVAVDLCAIVQVLLEVAASVQHLHNMQLLHCDIKPENVLLKSDNSNPLGFTTKLSDFGLAKLLRDNYYIINRSGSGTVTHLAPELFQVGSKITTAVDTFSFGIMMWELYTGQRAYSGLGRDAIIDRVYKKQSRPVFPSGVPALYSNLARQCWETDVHLRPSFAQIRKELQEMLAAFQSGTYAGAGAAAEAVRERLQAATIPHNQLLPHQLEQLQLQQLALQQQQQHLQQKQQAGILAGSFAMQGMARQQAQLRAQLLQQEQQQQQQLLLNPEVQQHFEQMKLLYQQEFGQQLLQQQAAQLQAQQAAVQAAQQQHEGQNGEVPQLGGSQVQLPLAQQLLQQLQQQQLRQGQGSLAADQGSMFAMQANEQQQHIMQQPSAQPQPQQQQQQEAVKSKA